MKRNSRIFFSHGFTLVEIMIVMAIIGILAAALFPSLTTYLKRGRDTTRVSDIDQLSKAHTSYLSDNEKYPDADTYGCVNQIAILRYVNDKTIQDPSIGKSNGCGTLRHYGYGSGSFVFNPNVFALVAIMEQEFGGNYSGSLSGFMGTVTPTAYNSGLTLTAKGAGPYYVRIP